jgi:predicted DNA-binding transcriptional regulator AlpA
MTAYLLPPKQRKNQARNHAHAKEKNMDKHLGGKELAKRWGMSVKTLDRWRWEGRGPQHMKIGGKILYRLSDVEQFERQAVRQETKKDNGMPLSEAA